ncbi:MAG: ABC transporter permease [Bacteroidales bacterium]|nr:ABC transporter permease [Bacteroidales bacterium]
MRLADLFSKSKHGIAEEAAGLSVSHMVWQRLRHNVLAMISMGVIVLFAVVAVLGYLITPDPTPYCNQQYLELATQKPMSRATFLCVHEAGAPAPERPSLIGRMIHGAPLPYTAIPIYSHHYEGDTLVAETFTGSVPNDGETRRFARSQVVKIETRTFVLGTDGYGRDVLSQIMIGGRVSLSVGFIAIAIALLIGITLGAMAGYFGGWVDNLIVWLINVVWSIPTVLLVIAITFALGKGFWQVFIAVGLTIWVDVARVVRGQVLSLKEKEFVEAAHALGYSHFRTIVHHILPNTTGAIIVIAASNFATAILLEAGLSFLGIGVQPPMPSWGSMVKENYGYILLDSAYLAFIPGVAIMLLVLAFMLLGNGLRDAMDIRRTDD